MERMSIPANTTRAISIHGPCSAVEQRSFWRDSPSRCTAHTIHTRGKSRTTCLVVNFRRRGSLPGRGRDTASCEIHRSLHASACSGSPAAAQRSPSRQPDPRCVASLIKRTKREQRRGRSSGMEVAAGYCSGYEVVSGYAAPLLCCRPEHLRAPVVSQAAKTSAAYSQ